VSDQRWQNVTPAPERDDRRVRWLWRMVIGLVLAFAPGAAYLLQQNECLKLSYSVEGLWIERDGLLEEERRLRVKRSGLESLAEIRSWAIRDGLVAPAEDRVVVVGQPPVTAPDQLVARTPTDSPPVR